MRYIVLLLLVNLVFGTVNQEPVSINTELQRPNRAKRLSTAAKFGLGALGAGLLAYGAHKAYKSYRNNKANQQMNNNLPRDRDH